MLHKFHIPVLGLGFSIDTPLKVSKYGISSVVSIVDDVLIERMREYHTKLRKEPFKPVLKQGTDSRARRITSYLNMLQRMVDEDFEALKKLPFEPGNELCRYFELLPETSQLKQGYELMMEYPEGERKAIFQNILRKQMVTGAIDVNIMAKVDRLTQPDGVEDLDATSEALSALRGFANSNLNSSVVLSAGMNPRLYGYLEKFNDFFPGKDGVIKKRIILKVSDFRSALIQAKFLAKKGLWVSEFRIESGLNCGGHAFATAGQLLGPILEAFKQSRQTLRDELFLLYKNGLQQRGIIADGLPKQRISVQGGIGTAAENEFLIRHYGLDATGWGSPFLLVPEVTNVDETTLQQLSEAGEDAFYLSNSSPLGVLFNNFRGSSIDQERQERILKGRPGSPCKKKYLCNNTEFTADPICTASREYQHLKINDLKAKGLSGQEFETAVDQVTEKLCLCEGLCSSAYQKLGMLKPKESKAVAICPGPNLAYFSKVYALEEMVGHIYGRKDLLEKVQRPNMLIKELELYIQYLGGEITLHMNNFSERKQAQLSQFKEQLLEGVQYYKALFQEFPQSEFFFKNRFFNLLLSAESRLNQLFI